MKVVPISQYLSEFSDESPTEEVPVPPEHFAELPKLESCQLESRDNDHGEFDKGLVECRTQVEEELVLRLDEQKMQLTTLHEEQIELVRRDIAEKLTEQLSSGLEEIENTIANSIASIINPLARGMIESRVLADLAKAIKDIVSDPQSSQITISGPLNLLNVLEENLASGNVALNVVEADDCEIRVELGQEKIESRLQAWSELLKSGSG